MCILVFNLPFFEKFFDPTIITSSFAEACINGWETDHINNHYIFTIAFHRFLDLDGISFCIGRVYHMCFVTDIELRNHN